MEIDVIFHVYNRGCDKRNLFLDNIDRSRFVRDIYEFNDDKLITNSAKIFKTPDEIRTQRRSPRDLLVNIHCFVLMDNHYHFMLSECKEGGISKFMRKLNTGYANYFNERHDRSGTLFQGRYKKVPLISDAHFNYLPLYIHLNPLDRLNKNWRLGKLHNIKQSLEYLTNYKWSSHRDYLGFKNLPSLTSRELLNEYFGGPGGYEREIREYLKSLGEHTSENLSDVIIEKD